MAGTARRPGRRARHGFHEVLAGVEAIALVAAEEERLVLHDRAANRAAELVLSQRRLGAGRCTLPSALRIWSK